MAQLHAGEWFGRFRRHEEEPLPLVRRRVDGALAPPNPWATYGSPDLREWIAEPAYDDTWRAIAEDEYWDALLADRHATMEWTRRRPRRVAAKLVGWISIVGALFVMLAISSTQGARDAMLEWGTLAAVETGR